MGTIPISLNDTQYRSNPEAPALPANFGMNRFAAVQERAQVIGKIGGQISDIATQYAAKNKAADLRADALAAQAELSSINADADLQAKSTTDPAKIRQIYEDAHIRYTEYVSGVSTKEGREGVPNVRWGEQKKELIGSSGAVMSQFRTRGESRIAEVGRQATNATALQTVYDGIQTGNHDLIKQGWQIQVDNGTLTPEEATLKQTESFVRADTLDVKTNVSRIENAETVEKAKEMSADFITGLTTKEDDGSYVVYQNLQKDDREDFVIRANAAVERVQKRVDAVAAEEDRVAMEKIHTAIADNNLPDFATKKELLGFAPGLSAAHQSAIMSKPEKTGPLTIEEFRDVRKAIADIYLMKPDEQVVAAGMIRKRVSPELYPELNAQLQGVMGREASTKGPMAMFWAQEVLPSLVSANTGGNWGKEYSVKTGTGKKASKAADSAKTSEFYEMEQKEFRFFNQYIAKAQADGMSESDAQAAYLKTPRFQQMKRSGELKAFFESEPRIFEGRPAASTKDLQADFPADLLQVKMKDGRIAIFKGKEFIKWK